MVLRTQAGKPVDGEQIRSVDTETYISVQIYQGIIGHTNRKRHRDVLEVIMSVVLKDITIEIIFDV